MEKCHLAFTANIHINNSIALWKGRGSYRSISSYFLDESRLASDTSQYGYAANALDYLASGTCLAPQNMYLYRGMNVSSTFWETGIFQFNNFMACTPNREAATFYALGKKIPVLLELYISKGTPLGIIETVIVAKDGFDYRSIEEPQIYREMKELGGYKFDDKWEFLLAAKTRWRVNRVKTEKFDNGYDDEKIDMFCIQCSDASDE